jgi:hypothetical protein
MVKVRAKHPGFFSRTIWAKARSSMASYPLAKANGNLKDKTIQSAIPNRRFALTTPD